MIISHKKAHTTRSSGINRKSVIMDIRALTLIAIISLFLAGKSTFSSYRLLHVMCPLAIRLYKFTVNDNDRSFLHNSMGLRICNLLIHPINIFTNITVLLDLMPYAVIGNNVSENPAVSVFRKNTLVHISQNYKVPHNTAIFILTAVTTSNLTILLRIQLRLCEPGEAWELHNAPNKVTYFLPSGAG